MVNTLAAVAIVLASTLTPAGHLTKCGGDAECAALNPHIVNGYGSPLVQHLCETTYRGECKDLNGNGIIRGDIEMGA